jgi:hypothetical protein
MGLMEVGDPPERFWTRRTIWFGSAGVACYLLSFWLPPIHSTAILVVISIGRLSPLLVMLRGKRVWLAALCTPYPFRLALFGYFELVRRLPDDVAGQMSGPTAYLLSISGLLLASIPLTNWVIARSVSRRVDDHLRAVGRLLFALTALAALVSAPQFSLMIMKFIVQPVALAGYAAVLGWGTRRT